MTTPGNGTSVPDEPQTVSELYPRWITPPVLWTVFKWTGSGPDTATAFLSAHGITSTALLSGTTLILMIGSGALTFANGMSIVLRNDGDGWRLDQSRSNTVGLQPYSDYYVSPAPA